jgi:hypothetical protein
MESAGGSYLSVGVAFDNDGYIVSCDPFEMPVKVSAFLCSLTVAVPSRKW